MSNMRILKRDEQEFKRITRNYKAKKNRIRKKTKFSLSDIDKELGVEIPTLKDFKKGNAFSTRKEFNEFKKQLSITNARGFEPLSIKTNAKGLKYPSYIEKVGKKAVSEASEKVDTMRDSYSKLPLIVEGTEIGTVSQQQLMLTDKEAYGLHKPSQFDIDTYTNPKSVEKSIERNKERQTDEYFDKRMEQMQTNFISMFDESEDEETAKLMDRIKAINPRDFYELYLMLPEMAFEDWDSDEGGSISGDKSPFETMDYFISAYENGEMDLSLKGVG